MKDFIKSRYFIMGILFSIFFVVVMWTSEWQEDSFNANLHDKYGWEPDEFELKLINTNNNLHAFLTFVGLAETWALTIGFYSLDKSGFWDRLKRVNSKGGME